MLDLQQLKTFRVVAMTKSFTRAAAELGCSQSNVTTRIKLLERELGAPLFERFRFSRKVVLTEVGRRTFEYAGQLLALADETRVAIHNTTDPSGQLRVSAPESLLTYRLPALLQRFQSLYPQVRLGVTSNVSSEMLIVSLTEGLVDLAFVVDQPVRSDKITAESLVKEELLLVAAPEHSSSARAEPWRPEDLAGEALLFSDSNCPFRLLLNRILRDAGVRLENPLEVGSIEAVKQCAIAGMGIAILPRFAVLPQLERKQLVPLPWTGPELAAYTQMMRSKSRWTLPALSALWNLVHDALKSQLAFQL